MADYKILSLKDQDSWQSILPADQNVFGSAEFARIAAKTRAGEPRLFLFSEGEYRVAYPYFLRRIDGLPFVERAEKHLADIQSPEFSGPLLLRGRPRAVLSPFIRTFHEYCVAQGIVAEFARLHPWRSAGELFDSSCVFLNRAIVYVDLSQSLEEIWHKSLNHQCRGGIRKAELAGVNIIEGGDVASISSFYRVYIDTVRRHNAAEKYCHPLSYFQAFFTELPFNSRFVLAEHKGRVVACSLYLFDKEDLYAYLGGLDLKYQDLRPRNALTYEMIKWGKANGKKRLILGGGYRPDDGVFRHKASFSPLRANFNVLRQVHIPEVYGRLCRQCSVFEGAECGEGGFFPAYRISEEKSL